MTYHLSTVRDIQRLQNDKKHANIILSTKRSTGTKEWPVKIECLATKARFALAAIPKTRSSKTVKKTCSAQSSRLSQALEEKTQHTQLTEAYACARCEEKSLVEIKLYQSTNLHVLLLCHPNLHSVLKILRPTCNPSLTCSFPAFYRPGGLTPLPQDPNQHIRNSCGMLRARHSSATSQIERSRTAAARSNGAVEARLT